VATEQIFRARRWTRREDRVVWALAPRSLPHAAAVLGLPVAAVQRRWQLLRRAGGPDAWWRQQRPSMDPVDLRRWAACLALGLRAGLSVDDIVAGVHLAARRGGNWRNDIDAVLEAWSQGDTVLWDALVARWATASRRQALRHKEEPT
jgi:hypothetical protein